ncbi:WG repeat-containing protein [Tenacibaculum ascidiaceicola]|uniref:WG repeat-containing protein n=1 Tax=Tenacibaculum ascidiaceicola TaxID=1699411 RepID=UPI0039EAAAF6
MKNKILLLVLVIVSSYSFSQEKIKADITIMNFLGRVPLKTESNSLADNLIRFLYYNPQPKNYPKIGFLNNKGKIVIKAKYSMASDFYNGHANIIKDSVYGYINKKGEEVLFNEYEKSFFYYNNTGIAKKKGKYGLINRKGDSLTNFSYTMINNFGFNYFRGHTENKRSQIIDKEGNIIFNKDLRFNIRSHYIDVDSIFIFEEEVKGKKLRGLVNIRGEVLSEPKYKEIYFINDKKFYVVKNNDKYGFINKQGNEIIPPTYEKVSFNINDNLIAVKKEGKWGYINRENKEIIPFIYDEAYAFFDGLAFVKKGKFYGCIDVKNRVKIDFKLEKTKYPFFANRLALYKKDNKFGFINKKGKIKIEAKYDKVLPFVNGLAYVELNGKAGYINKKGKEIVPIKYNQLWFVSEDLIRYAN